MTVAATVVEAVQGATTAAVLLILMETAAGQVAESAVLGES